LAFAASALVSSQTGSGKTAAFVLPGLQRLRTPSALAGKGPRVLVLTRTRELAMQVQRAMHGYCSGQRLLTACLVRGVPFGKQLSLVRKPVDIVIATPGRLKDHMDRGSVDRMLDGYRDLSRAARRISRRVARYRLHCAGAHPTRDKRIRRSLQGRSSCRRRLAHRLTPCPRAGQNRFVDLGLADYRQLLDVAQHLSEILRRGGLGSILHQVNDSREHGAHLGEHVERSMGALGQLDRFLVAEQALDEAIDLLPADKSDARNTLPGRRHLESNQSKRSAAVLMDGQAVPQSHHQRADELVDCVEAFELRQLAAPQSLHRIQRRGCHERRCNIAEEPRPYLVEGHGTPPPLEQRGHRIVARSAFLCLSHGLNPDPVTALSSIAA